MSNELRKLAEAATPGKWFVNLHYVQVLSGGNKDICFVPPPNTNAANNRVFIAAANPAAITALLDEKDALTARVAELEAALPVISRIVSAAPDIASPDDVPEDIAVMLELTHADVARLRRAAAMEGK